MVESVLFLLVYLTFPTLVALFHQQELYNSL